MTTEQLNEVLRVEHYDKVPGRCACPVGCCFMFSKKAWSEVKYKDGSIGFPEWLKSLYEDFTFAQECMKLGYRNYMLRYPRLYHCLGNTFCSNPELKCYDQLLESRKRFIEYYGGDEHMVLDKFYEEQKKTQEKSILKYLGDGLKKLEKQEEDWRWKREL